MYASLEGEYRRRLREDYHLPADHFDGIEMNLARLEAALRATGESLAETEEQAARDFDSRAFHGFPNAMWRAMLDDLLQGLESSGFAPDMAKVVIYVGQVPDATLNACAIAVERNSRLILVNSGLMQLFNRLSRITIGSYQYSTNSEVQAEISFGCAERLSKCAYDLLFAHGKEFYVHLRSEKLIRSAMMLVAGLEYAVLAHELGHVIELRRRQKKTSPGAAHREELIADAVSDLACDCAVPIVAKRYGYTEDYVGLFFFGAHRLLYHILAATELVAMSKGILPSGSHPRGTQRGIQLIRRHQRVGVPEAPLEFASALCSHFDAITARWAEEIADGSNAT